VFNTKLQKQMKVSENTVFVNVDLSRHLFARHGLHINMKGKELAAKKTVSTITF
jgi:hypothetical protein